MPEAELNNGKCFCGSVEITVTGEPVAMGYCHCASCRSWSAGPVNAFTLWPPDRVKVTKGSDQVGTYHKTDKSQRKWCKRCGGHLFTDHPLWKVIDVYAANHSRPTVQTRATRQLSGVGTADPRRPA